MILFRQRKPVQPSQENVNFKKLPRIDRKKNEILEIIDEAGTPLFIADKKILTDKIKTLETSLKKWGNYKIAYSLKTNYEIPKLNILKKHGVLMEVVSGREYQIAKKFGCKGEQIIFNGPYKRDAELSYALKSGSLINIDNFNELTRVIKIVEKGKSQKHNVGMRVNANLPYIDKSRFGFSIENNEAKLAISMLSSAKNINLVNFHIHIGTDIDRVISYKEAARNICKFIEKNVFDHVNTIKSLDFGGGYPASGLAPFGKKNWNPQPISAYIDAIINEVNQVFKGKNKPTIVIEPGRFLVDDAVFFITKIVNFNTAGDKQLLTTDAAITMLPLVYYRPQIVKLFNHKLIEKTMHKSQTLVYGATCKEDDILYKRPLPKAKTNDYIVFYVVGAYNQSMASDFIYKKPLFKIIS